MKSWKTTAAGVGGLMTTIGSVLNQLCDGNPATNPDWNLVLPIIFTSLIGIFARDNGVSSEQVGADENTKMLKKFSAGPVPMILLTALLSFGAMTTFTGCTTPQTREAAIYYTLADIKTMADAAEKVYGNQVALGHVTLAQQAKIDAKITRLHRDYTLALRLARSNPAATSPAELQKLADDFVMTINQLSK
jgi:hypothetical protein